MTVGFICVTYRSSKWANRFIRSIATLDQAEDCAVVVVDNGGEEDRFVLDGASHARLTVVRPSHNLGYFGGAAFGLEALRQLAGDCEFVIVCNVDLEFPKRDFITRLAHISSSDQIGVIAPAIRSAITTRDQNPFLTNRPSALRMHAYKWIFSNYACYTAYQLSSDIYKRLRSNRRPVVTASAGDTIYSPHGSLIIFTREYFSRGGTLDYPCFLFSEEIFVAETCLALGLPVIYRPELEVVHQEHVVTGRFRAPRMVRYARDSARFCADHYFPLRVQ